MDAIKFAALIDANPDHAAMLGKAFAAGKTEDQIQVQLADAKTSATTAKLTADLAVATAAQVKLAADLTAEKTAHQATADKLNKLSALVPTNVDPGGLPISTQPAPTDAALQAEWSAFSADKKSEFLSDFATFKHYATHDRGQAKPAAQE